MPQLIRFVFPLLTALVLLSQAVPSYASTKRVEALLKSNLTGTFTFNSGVHDLLTKHEGYFKVDLSGLIDRAATQSGIDERIVSHFAESLRRAPNVDASIKKYNGLFGKSETLPLQLVEQSKPLVPTPDFHIAQGNIASGHIQVMRFSSKNKKMLNEIWSDTSILGKEIHPRKNAFHDPSSVFRLLTCLACMKKPKVWNMKDIQSISTY